jgi:hypothetical protein
MRAFFEFHSIVGMASVRTFNRITIIQIYSRNVLMKRREGKWPSADRCKIYIQQRIFRLITELLIISF